MCHDYKTTKCLTTIKPLSAKNGFDLNFAKLQLKLQTADGVVLKFAWTRSHVISLAQGLFYK